MDSSERLRYVGADQLETPVGRLAGASLVSPSDEKLGRLDGAVIDPVERHVCYYIIHSGGWFGGRRYLVPALPARLDAERRALQVDLEPDQLNNCSEWNRDSFPPYSDEDLLSAMFFSSRA